MKENNNMNNKVKLIAVAILVVLTGYTIFINKPTEDAEMDLNIVDTTLDINETSELTALPDAVENETTSNRYLEYTEDNLTNNAATKRVLFFYASWCPTCQPVNKELSEATSIPEDVTVLRVNYNDTDTDEKEKELAEKYQVTYQHTFVQIDSDGNEVTKWNGGGLKELLANIK